MTRVDASRIRLYRLWRTSALLMAVGAAEFGFLAWSRRQPWLWLVVAGLAAAGAAALRRARVQRRHLEG